MDPVRTPSSLEATGTSENDAQVMIPVSDDELVAPTMAGFGTPEVPLDGSQFGPIVFLCLHVLSMLKL